MLFFANDDGTHVISIVELNNIDHNTRKDAYIDVRKKDEWDTGHISWFTHIPLDRIGDNVEELKKHERVFIICQSGGRSSMAGAKLKDAGITNVYNIDGGMEEWVRLGFPVVVN